MRGPLQNQTKESASMTPARARERLVEAEALAAAGRTGEALERYAAAIEADPKLVRARLGRAGLLLVLARREEAAAAFAEVIALEPGHAIAHCNRGIALANLNRHEAALACFERAIALEPAMATAHFRRAGSLLSLKRYEAAIAGYDTAISLRPDSAAAHCNRGAALLELGRYEEALAACDKAISANPRFAEAWGNRGNLLLQLNRLDDAVASFERAIELDPGQPRYRYNKGSALLCGSLSEAGWRLYGHRLESQRFADFGLPLVVDGDLRDKRILLQWEAKFGDAIMMLRYLPELARSSRGCMVQLPDDLRELAARSFPEARVVGLDAAADAQYRVALGSLPLILRTFSEADIPRAVPYLRPAPEKVASWRRELQSGRRANVGLCWRGAPQVVGRSVPLADLGPLLANRHIRFVALQKDLTAEEESALFRNDNVLPLAGRLSTFDDTAALMEALDLVVSIDTSVAHLAGALARPLWVMLKHGLDWRWPGPGSGNPWYPTARLYRQPASGRWGSVIAAIGEDLRRQSPAIGGG
jgi:tetratricopeptide (TPR) repeat protein